MNGPPPDGAQARCATCGGILSLDDLSLPACRYCGAVHAHVARAAEKVAVVHGLMGGVLVPPHGQFQQGHSPVLPGVVMPGAPPSPPMTGGPVPIGASPSTAGGPGSPHAYGQVAIHQPSGMVGAHAVMRMTQKKMITFGILIAVGVALFFVALGLGAVWLLWGG